MCWWQLEHRGKEMEERPKPEGIIERGGMQNLIRVPQWRSRKLQVN